MTDRYCPAGGPGSPICPRSICDCFIDQFPDDMELAGGLHPEFFRVVGTETNDPGDPSPCCAACDRFGDDGDPWARGCGLPGCGCHNHNEQEQR